MQCGKEKLTDSDVYLSSYTIPVISINNTSNTTVNATKEEHLMSKQDMMIDLIKSKLDMNYLIFD